MAVRADVVLLADGGDVTVGRDIATFVYGEFRVVIPEGREQVETDRRLQDGYIYRPSTDISPFDIGFARADATIDLEVQSTDLEVVVDQAQRSAGGDVFFEREITVAGLGEYTPGVDFVVGDVVSVELRGRRMLLPVREIAMLASESDGVVGWRVVVGGVLVSDRDEVRRRYDAVRRQVANDKRELARSAGRAAAAASAAQSTANTAQSTADVARGEVQAVRDSLAGQSSQEPDLVAQLVAVNAELQRLGQSPQPSLMLAFVQLSTALWQAQQKINAQQQQINAQQATINAQQEEINAAQSAASDALYQAQLAAARDMTRMLFADREQRVWDAFLEVAMPRLNRTVSVVQRGPWRGRVVMQVVYSDGVGFQRGRVMAGNERWVETIPNGNVANAVVFYQVESGASYGSGDTNN